MEKLATEVLSVRDETPAVRSVRLRRAAGFAFLAMPDGSCLWLG
jgi:ferredoxin-NADP reductase